MALFKCWMIVLNGLYQCIENNFYKFWWNQELECLKHESIDARTMWKHASKPRMGQIFARYKTTKMLYKNAQKNVRNRKHQSI